MITYPAPNHAPTRGRLARAVLALALLHAAALTAALAPQFAPLEVTFSGHATPPPSSSVCGFSLLASPDGPQVAVIAPAAQCVFGLRKGEEVCIAIGVQGVAGQFEVAAEARLLEGLRATVVLAVGDKQSRQTLTAGAPISLSLSGTGNLIRLAVSDCEGDTGVRCRGLRLKSGNDWFDVPFSLPPSPVPLPAAGGGGGRGPGAPPLLPPYRPAIEAALIEWDWRMQDGIGTEREARTYADAIGQTLQRGSALIADLRASSTVLGDEARQWDELRRRYEQLKAALPLAPSPPREGVGGGGAAAWEELWRLAHLLRRRIAVANPLIKGTPLAFVKQVPGAFSHQLTQYYGRYAKPGGGVFVLERPGETMHCRSLTAGALKEGSYQHLDVSYDADKLLFSYCQCDTAPGDSFAGQQGRYYNLYEIAADRTGLRQLTAGPYNDFAPRYLPDGRMVFISTRRGGWHRCGSPGCENYTLALADAGGANPRTVSCHETQEWDPAVLSDGRIIYCRWDYVDRHAVYYEQLWTVRTDGSNPTAFYGNNTFNPVGTFEPRAVPGSHRVIATAAAHHAMTAGSIVLVDPRRGLEGLEPLTRLTPDALFPESETLLAPQWRGAVPVEPPVHPVEARRWPGHCYRSPFPLSETYFLAAYSFDTLLGEPKSNSPNMFGLYLVDAFGNKELLYRDLNIASLWPALLRPRKRPPTIERVAGAAATAERARGQPGTEELPTFVAWPQEATPSAPLGRSQEEGLFYVQNVYAATPALPPGSVKRLRIVQVLPKSTPGINNPSVGLANASPGKQVLGTVPIAADGSAFFRAPAGVALSFQALDERGQAVQVMRSVTYLQSGEAVACVGCHEQRMTAPPLGGRGAALSRGPSAIAPGPDGSRPLSYPILVQPVLDKQCIRCHCKEDPKGKVVLTGEPQGHYTASYNAMAPLVPFSQWGSPGDFRKTNSEPLATPGFFGARGSKFMQKLLTGHEEVRLSPDEIERLATWMDANALFYGTFDPADQARQQRGQRIEGPKLE